MHPVGPNSDACCILNDLGEVTGGVYFYTFSNGCRNRHPPWCPGTRARCPRSIKMHPPYYTSGVDFICLRGRAGQNQTGSLQRRVLGCLANLSLHRSTGRLPAASGWHARSLACTHFLALQSPMSFGTSGMVCLGLGSSCFVFRGSLKT